MLYNATTGTRFSLRGKLDTGADMTVLPERVVGPLGVPPHGHVWTRGFDASCSLRSVYYVGLTVEGFDLPAVGCVATDRSDILLGRNVLNSLYIVLDGRRLNLVVQRR